MHAAIIAARPPAARRTTKHVELAALARELCGELFTASEHQLTLLEEACCGHSDGHLLADVTVQTCWDADRLDLARVGIIPDASKLCTEAARSPALIERAMERSERWSRWSWERL